MRASECAPKVLPNELPREREGSGTAEKDGRGKGRGGDTGHPRREPKTRSPAGFQDSFRGFRTFRTREKILPPLPASPPA